MKRRGYVIIAVAATLLVLALWWYAGAGAELKELKRLTGE